MSIKFLKYFFVSILILFLISLISGIIFYFIWYQIATPLTDNVSEAKFIVEKDSSLKSIAIDLEEAGLIRNNKLFIGYVYYKGWGAKLQAGEYILSPSLNIIQIAKKIFKGDAFINEIQITIPEGFNLRQIDARLAKSGLINQGDLLIQSQNLEGYLFPDTYKFSEDENLNDIIDKMRNNFEAKVNEKLILDIDSQDKDIDEIITMASILEKEVRTYYDKQVASGIFWKRIDTNYPLQSCATIAYALGVDKWRYSIDDTKIDSPYNTYQNIGLPPRPICNPGLDSIKAAIYPIETEYNFFLSKPDTGETVFSKTFEEHNANKAKYLTR
ncbi:endolytic transglycosylase MltG [Patescibacteria group bacterium]